MKTFLSAILATLFLAPTIWGQDISLEIKGGDVKIVEVDRVIVVKDKRQVVTTFPFSLNVPKGEALYFWSFPPTVKAVDRGDSLEITSAPKGDLTISVKGVSAKLDNEGRFIGFITKTGSLFFSVGEVKPGPGPEPDPDPDPKPDPDPPPPTPTGGLTVLISYESADKGKYPSTQTAIFTSVPVREYLKAKCVVDPAASDNKAYRIWDKDETGKGDAKIWQDLAARPRATLPWIYISNGKAVYEGPLPLTPDATIELLKKYGG